MPKTILIVDDDPGMRNMLSMVFEEAGFISQTARNGQEALRLLEHQRPSLVVSDLMMPMLDGCELYRRMQAHPTLHDIPFVVISSLSPNQIKQCAITPAAYIPKPCNLAVLLATVEQLLDDTPNDADL